MKVTEAIFISYRRSNSAGTAGRLYDTMTAHFGEDRVFMDVDSIRPGEDFAEVLTRTLSECRAVVVVIDPDWLTIESREGRRRLDELGDYVRLEIEHALSAHVRLFPVLVDGALMPSTEDLPPSLQSLARSQATEISSSRYRYDVGRLLSALELVLSHEGTVRTTTSGSNFRTDPRRVLRWRRIPSLLILGVALLIAAIIGVWNVQGASTPKWSALASLPTPLEGAGVTSFNGRLWVAGGVSAEEGRPLLDTVNIFDPINGSWSRGPQLPRPVAFAPLVLANGQLYLLGGQTSAGAIANVLKLDSATGMWLEDAPLPEPRETGAAAWDGSRVVYAGGVGQDHAVSSDVFALEGGAWRTIGRLQIAREKATATTDGFGTTWVIGGRDRNSGILAYGAVDVIQTDKVTAGSAVDPVHSSSALWLPGAGPCALGGDTGERPRADIRCLRGGPDFPPLPEARAGIGSAVMGAEVYVVGGYDAGGHGTAALHVLRLKN
jgi:hypothetical protein